MKPLATLGAATALAAALAACQTTPTSNTDLDNARQVLSQASANPYASRAAAVELDRAQQAMRRAESAWNDRHDKEETQHLAYVAQRRAETVVARARQAEADERLQQAGAMRDRVRLEARTREADAASRTAQSAQSEADQARAQLAQQGDQSRQQAEASQRQLAQQAERTRAMERDLQALKARPTPRGMVVTLGDVLFSTGRATLQPGAQRSVQQLADVLKQNPERRVRVEGFTDSTGSEESNLALSQQRADAFRQALLNSGVPTERIEVQAHGEAYPVADNTTPAGRQQNRRVEVLFSDPQGRFAER
jgi:outer membrane protein OmpA-like peptidoglycan-associated protein